jgi:mycofactocin radical SAM maturase
VNFGGGEPFAREDFLHILEACHIQGLVTCVSTNGTLLSDEVLKFLRGRDMVYLQVSLDGATPETNDRIRGSGSFLRILEGLERLHSRDIPFIMNMVLTRLNYPELAQMHSLADELGAVLRISRFRPSGRGKAFWGELRLGEEELRAFSGWLTDHKDVVTGDSFFSIEEEERRGLGLNLCGAAKFTCCIGPRGNVYPCAFLQDGLFCGGNVLVQPLGKIWYTAHAFNLLRNLKIQSCESCFRFDSCHGGCPAIAYFTERTLAIPDPECLARCVSQA